MADEDEREMTADLMYVGRTTPELREAASVFVGQVQKLVDEHVAFLELCHDDAVLNLGAQLMTVMFEDVLANTNAEDVSQLLHGVALGVATLLSRVVKPEGVPTITRVFSEVVAVTAEHMAAKRAAGELKVRQN